MYKCDMCGGYFEINDDFLTATCDHCGRVIPLNDEMKLYANELRAKHLEKLKQEEYKNQQENYKIERFKKGIFSKVLLLFAILCLIIGFNNFRTFRFVTSIISLVQAGLFSLAWLMGMNIIKEKRPNLHVAVAILAFILIIPSVNSQNIVFYGDTSNSNINFGKHNSPSINEEMTTNEKKGIYVFNVKNYVGKNLASFGKTEGDYRIDEYGAGDIKFVFTEENGVFINVKDEEQLKQYIVVDQSLKTNDKIINVHLRDYSGNPYDYSVDYQNHEEIILLVKKIGSSDPINFEFSKILPAPDRRTMFIRDYKGRNLASIGELYGDFRIDEYGDTRIKIIISSVDGTFVNPKDINDLRKYVVVSQDINPNTQLDIIYSTDYQGKEYNYSIKSQNIEEINLTVSKLDKNIISQTKDVTTSKDSSSSNNDSNSSSYKESDLSYKVMLNGKIEITGYKGDASSVSIPSEIDGKEVVKIGSNAFKNNTNLESIIIWASLTEIDSSAFEGCKNLIDISIPSETTLIGKNAFKNCDNLESVIIWGNPSIGDYAFYGCKSLESISISSDTKYVGSHAFEGCSSMDSLIIWGVEEIKDFAFKDCTSLTSVSIPSEVKSIGSSAFEGCKNLENVIIWGDDTKIGKNAFANCPKLDEVPQ